MCSLGPLFIFRDIFLYFVSFVWFVIRLSSYLGKYEVCSNSIRIGIVVVVHWVGCVCNQS